MLPIEILTEFGAFLLLYAVTITIITAALIGTNLLASRRREK